MLEGNIHLLYHLIQHNLDYLYKQYNHHNFPSKRSNQFDMSVHLLKHYPNDKSLYIDSQHYL